MTQRPQNLYPFNKDYLEIIKMIILDLDYDFMEDRHKYGKILSWIRQDAAVDNKDTEYAKSLLALLEKCSKSGMPFSMVIYDVNKLIKKLRK